MSRRPNPLGGELAIRSRIASGKLLSFRAYGAFAKEANHGWPRWMRLLDMRVELSMGTRLEIAGGAGELFAAPGGGTAFGWRSRFGAEEDEIRHTPA